MKIVELVPLEVYLSTLNQMDYYAQNLVIITNVEQVPVQRVWTQVRMLLTGCALFVILLVPVTFGCNARK